MQTYHDRFLDAAGLVKDFEAIIERLRGRVGMLEDKTVIVQEERRAPETPNEVIYAIVESLNSFDRALTYYANFFENTGIFTRSEILQIDKLRQLLASKMMQMSE
jgi:hypothetical protein